MSKDVREPKRTWKKQVDEEGMKVGLSREDDIEEAGR